MNKRNTIAKNRLGLSGMILLLICTISCTENNNNHKETFNEDKVLDYCVEQARKTLSSLHEYDQYPRCIEKDKTEWQLVPPKDWTSGFWPGTLWYLYEYTGDEYFKAKADSFTSSLKPLAYRPAANHDLGFMMYCSYGNGLRLTDCSDCEGILLNTAYRLRELYNPKVGTILSWPGMVEKMNWPHNTIVDNMMNLELLYWAGKTGRDSTLIDIANQHAQTTLENQFRDDYTVYHVIVYDTITGEKIKGVTHQGYDDETMWARGQAWAIYGFTMAYRESGKPEFLDVAQKATDVYLDHLPEDLVPYWDFNAPGIPDEPKDASAAAITASALLELFTFVHDDKKAESYYNKALAMLRNLSSDEYLSRDKNTAFLLHSTGHKPENSEIDVSINYADYYFLEALIRLHKLKKSNQS